MTGPAFVDTNILVYARDAGEPVKQARAMDVLRVLWETRRGRVSLQVLQEYYVTVTCKLKPGLPQEDARDDVIALLAWRPLATSGSTLTKAWEIEDRFGFSWWDSLIVASALENRCQLLLSEDLQDGQQIDGLRILNPFATEFEVAMK
jgi:predicted nucleic acid-binding protein